MLFDYTVVGFVAADPGPQDRVACQEANHAIMWPHVGAPGIFACRGDWAEREAGGAAGSPGTA